MGIKHICIRAAVGRSDCHIRVEQDKLVLKNLHGMVSIKHTCPHGFLPSHRPSAGSIATSDKTLVYCLIKCSVFVWRNLIARISAPEMRQMTMRRILSIPVFLPFLYLSVFTNLPWSNLCLQSIKSICEIRILTKSTSCKSCILQQVIDHLVIHGNSSEKGNVCSITVRLGIRAYTRMILR